MPTLRECALRLGTAVQALRLSLGESDRRGPWGELEAQARVQQALAGLTPQIQHLIHVLASVAGHHEALDACLERVQELLGRLNRLARPPADNAVHWFETAGRSWRLHETPLEIAEVFRSRLKQPGAAWVFTSATLAMGEDFDHFTSRLGIEQAETARWDSPFDYRRQALYFIPHRMPEPSAADYNRHLLELACELLDYSQGRAFLLFTSHRALREVAKGLADRIRYPLSIQGAAPGLSCSNAFVDSVMRSCWGPQAFGRGWMCVVRPYPVS
ncbi:hypothetical protein [Caldichromatium japonicum]|uniref:ATP-dependent DNA helicase n=1 Tax=Caldichromatium japonicum TaxID=2699430 RepID=UPI0031B5EDB1